MRRILFWVLLISLVGLAFATQGDVLIKIAYVDTARVLREYTKAQKATEKMNADILSKQRQIKEMEEEIKNLQQEFEFQKGLMPEEVILRKEEIIKQKTRDLQIFRSEVTKSISIQQERLTQIILDDVYKMLKQIGVEKGYSLILEKSGIPYASEELDITNEVIERLNAQAAKAETGSPQGSTEGPPAQPPGLPPPQVPGQIQPQGGAQ
ncbi:MAG: OmpH family outer membrane protein [bacterium]